MLFVNFPSTPLNSIMLFIKSIQLYSQTFMTTLAFAFMVIGFNFCISVMSYLPFIPNKGAIPIILMIGKILVVPLIAAFFHFQACCLTQSSRILNSIITSMNQFIPLMLSIIYLSFIPLILMSLGIGSFLILDPNKISFTIRIGILIACSLTTIFMLVTKILTPILVILDNLDAQAAQAKSVQLAKGFYFKTLFLGIFPILIGITLFWIPTLLHITYPKDTPYAYLVYQGMGDALVGLIGPLISMTIIVLLNDLNLRKKN